MPHGADLFDARLRGFSVDTDVSTAFNWFDTASQQC
jgi:hypothetical protein